MDDRILKRISDIYGKKGSIEVEFRVLYGFKSNVGVIKKILNFPGKKSLEKTINCIQSTKDKWLNRIHQTIFVPSSGKQKTNTYTKHKLFRPIFDQVDGIKFKIAVAEEKDIKEFKAEYCDLIRMKNRLSSVLDALTDWRMDITLVKTLPHEKEFDVDSLDEYVKKLFPKNLTVENFSNIAPWNYADAVELELEFVGEEAPTQKDIENCIKFISKLPITKGDIEPTLLAKVARWIKPGSVNKFISGEFSLKKLAPQVLSLDINKLYDVLLPNIKLFFVSPKLDGIRTILLLDNDTNEYYSINDSATQLSLLDFGCDVKKGGGDMPNETILDSELYEGKYYIFDVIAYKGESVFKRDYKERVKFIDKVLDDFSGCSNLVKKPLFFLGKDKLDKILKTSWKFETDGYVFTPGISSGGIRANYMDSKAFKWKPLDMLSVDFLLEKKILYSGMNANVALKILPYSEKKMVGYGPVVFTPTYIPMSVISNVEDLHTFDWVSKEHDKVVVELVWNKDKWKMLRIREDRQKLVDQKKFFGNNHRIAELTWNSIFWYIEPKNLLGVKMTNYLKENTVVMNNRGYFIKLYMNLLERNKHRHLVDVGIVYPYFNYITRTGIKYMDFVVSDGFSCLNVIDQKYDRRFVDSPGKHIIIRAFKPIDYEKMKPSSERKLHVGLLPTKEQLDLIKILSKMSKDSFKVVVLGKQKNTLGKQFSIKRLDSVLPSENFDGKLQNLYLLECPF